MNRVALLIVALSLAAGAHAAEPAKAPVITGDDGPYVRKTTDGWEAVTVRNEDGKSTVLRSAVKMGETLLVPAVNALPAFAVRLRPPGPPAADEITIPADAPMFVIADTHGEYEIVTTLLQKQGIIDKNLAWNFGRGHLVILGDVVDRGAHHLEILWLIYQLEAEAEKAGGGVHFVLGNHETMEMRGDLRYPHARYLHSAEVLGAKNYAELINADTLLGQWLRSKPAVQKINKLLCLHGGVSLAAVERNLTPAKLNATVRAVLNAAPPESEAEKERATFVMGPLGPLWYRGYFEGQDKRYVYATPADIDHIRDFYGVERILVGHTEMPTITPLYGGKVIAVQVYPHWDEKTGQPVIEGLWVKGGKLSRAKVSGEVEPLAGVN